MFGLGSICDEFERYFSSFFDNLRSDDLLVYIGRENPNKETKKETVMIARYPLPMGYEGVSAVIGPMRMAYDRNLRSEEHTSELQSQFHLVCRLLLEKKK